MKKSFTINIIKIYVLILYLTLINIELKAQLNCYDNPSFEGTSQAHVAPSPWNTCWGSPDTQPGQWGITLPASNGNTYVSFLLSNNYTYVEGVTQPLDSCMIAGETYTFNVDLAFSTTYNTASPGDCYGSFAVWGGNSACHRGELLYCSGEIWNTNWQTYTITFTPTQNWCYIGFSPCYIHDCNGYVNIMMDNISCIAPQPPELSIDVTNVSCYGLCDGSLTANINSGTPPYTYNWSNGCNTQVCNNLCPGTYYLTVIDSMGEQDTASAIVSEPPILTINLSTNNVSCFGYSNGNASVSVSGGTTPYSYQWSNGQTTSSISNLTIGNYFITVTDNNGCIDSNSVTINQPPLLVITANANPSLICQGSNSILSTNGANTYSWSNGMTGSNITVTPSNSTTYTVTGTNTDGCTATTTITVSVNPIPDISPTSDQTLCHNTQTTAINFTSSVTNTVFNWTNNNTSIGLAASGSGNIPSFTVTNTGSSPQTATVIATPSFTNNGLTCTGNSDTFLITVNPIPDIAPLSDQSLCANQLTTPVSFISTVNNTLFSWINDNPSIGLPSSGSGNIPSFTVLNEGLDLQIATIIVTPSFTNNGVTCTGASETFLINVFPLAIARFSILPRIVKEEDGRVQVIDESIGANIWYYDFGVNDDQNDIFTEREPMYIYTNAGNYIIMQIVNNQYNCPDTAYNDVTVKPSIIFWLPNAFTPNEDDQNETFFPLGFNVPIEDYEFRIFDRWGKQLFYTTDINVGWDGKFNGEYVKQDVYVYSIKVKLEDGPHVFRGPVYVLH